MITIPDEFEIYFRGLVLKVNVHTMVNRKVFEITFPDGRPNLMISRSRIANGSKMWMSIPEGRQEEAIPIGAEIVYYFKKTVN